RPFESTYEGFLYLTALKDLATRQIVGWSMAEHLKAGLCIDALVMALQRCRPPRGLIHHSDRGSQGGFKRSSQHSLCWLLEATGQAPPGVLQSSVFRGLALSEPRRVSRRRFGLDHAARAGTSL